MPDILMFVILFFGTIIGGIFCIIFLHLGINETESWKQKLSVLGFIPVIILLIFGGWKWIMSGDCKYDGFEYVKIERKDSVKFYVYKGYIYNLNKTVDDKEFKIHKWSNQWVNGIYYTNKSSTETEFVPIDEKETVESNNTVDKK